MLALIGIIATALVALTGTLTQILKHPRTVRQSDHIGVLLRFGKPVPYWHRCPTNENRVCQHGGWPHEVKDPFVYPGQLLWWMIPWVHTIATVKWHDNYTDRDANPLQVEGGDTWSSMFVLRYDLSLEGILAAVTLAGANLNLGISQNFHHIVGNVVIGHGPDTDREKLSELVMNALMSGTPLTAMGVVPRLVLIVQHAKTPMTQLTDTARHLFPRQDPDI